jgi:membrane protease subunit HflC
MDLRVKRINYTPAVSQTIYQRMVSERTQIAERFKSEGAGEAAKILGERERDLKLIESEAYRKVQEVEGAADAKASEIYAKAYNGSPESAELFEFLKTMEAYKTVITPDTSLILSTDSRFLRYLKSSDEPAAATPGSASADPLKGLPSLLDMVKAP